MNSLINYKMDTGSNHTVIKHNAEKLVEKECIAEERELSIKAVESSPAEFPCETPNNKFSEDQKQQMVGPDINITEVSKKLVALHS